MEKFAVDLDKVLNDFECNEEQLNEYSSNQSTIKNNAYSRDYKMYPHHYRTPASDYRHTSFEPVILADANFSVSARPQVQSNYVIPPLEDDTANIPVYEQLVRPKNVDDSISDGMPSFETYSFSKTKDFRPDLIESNADLSSNLNDFDRVERHLPDVASANVEANDEKVNFDLINNSVDRDPQQTSDAEESQPNVVRFPDLSDVPESELQKYLEELDQYEFAAEQQLQNDEAITSVDEENVNDELLIRVQSKNEGSTDKCDLEVGRRERDPSSSVECSVAVVTDDEDIAEKTTDGADPLTGVEITMHADADDTTWANDASTSDGLRTESSVVDSTDSVDVGNDDSDSIETKILTEESSGDFDSSKQLEESVGGENRQDGVDTSKADAQLPLVDESTASADESNECVSSALSEDVTNDSSLEIDDESESLRGDNDDVTQQPEILVHNDDGDRESDGGCVPTETVADKVTMPIVMSSDDKRRDDKLRAEATVSAHSGDTNAAIPTSESSYQILDSKAAISTFEPRNACEDGSQASTSKEAVVGAISEDVDQDAKPKLQRPDSLNLMHTTQTAEMSSTSADSGSLLSAEERRLGKEQPFWIPDSETTVCMQCQLKFTLVKRRHHCRACGLVLCSKCCDKKAKLEYLGFEEARVCHSCHSILERIDNLEADISSMRRPNPNNPMDYCSTIPPMLQVGPTLPSPPSVLVPVTGVLKREGRPKSNDPPKQVIFSDGIRPGGEMSDLDVTPESRLSLRRHTRVTKRVSTPPGNLSLHRRMLNPETKSFIPSNNDLPPIIVRKQGEYLFTELERPVNVDDEAVKFAINRNLLVIVKRIVLDCCVNRDVWCMTTEGLSCVGQDEIVFILEVLPDEKYPPKDVFSTVNMLYLEASKGSTVTEMSYASPCLNQLFGSKEHGGFVFIRPSYQCVQKLFLPKAPYLIALLIHRWETPWARLFPIRLVLRLGAEFRYYPCPLVSIRNRQALFTDIGHTIISLLADFRKYSYTLPSVRGLMIHMEDRLTTILLPRNRYDQVIRAMNNSEENVLAFAGNVSTHADSHLVCIQSTQDDTSYTTQAINIHNKPRQVTGASFIVFNGSLKQCAWAGKSNIVEDGLMVQIPSDSMSNLRTALKQMKDYSIGCGPHAEEVVMLKWGPDDVNFNIGVRSNIDDKPLDGVPSIRVHNGIDYSGSLRLIRWTEVFILQSDEESDNKTGDTVNISKLSESIARASCIALVPLLDLLATANLTTIAVRATIHPENVGYEAGSCGEKLPPIYMKSLDETLIAVVHEAAVAIRDISSPTVLELIFKIMEQG